MASSEKQYTFSVIYESKSDNAEAFVEQLTEMLEKENDENGEKMRGYFEGRDMLPGRNLLNEHWRVVAASKYVILVINESFLNKPWPEFLGQVTTKTMYDFGKGNDGLIVMSVNVAEETITAKYKEHNIKNVVYFDGKMPKDNKSLMDKLARVLKMDLPISHVIEPKKEIIPVKPKEQSERNPIILNDPVSQTRSLREPVENASLDVQLHTDTGYQSINSSNSTETLSVFCDEQNCRKETPRTIQVPVEDETQGNIISDPSRTLSHPVAAQASVSASIISANATPSSLQNQTSDALPTVNLPSANITQEIIVQYTSVADDKQLFSMEDKQSKSDLDKQVKDPTLIEDIQSISSIKTSTSNEADNKFKIKNENLVDSQTHTPIPAIENQANIPATENQANIPATENQANITATENQAIIPETENQDIIPATENQDIIPATENQDIIPATEIKATIPGKESLSNSTNTNENIMTVTSVDVSKKMKSNITKAHLNQKDFSKNKFKADENQEALGDVLSDLPKLQIGGSIKPSASNQASPSPKLYSLKDSDFHIMNKRKTAKPTVNQDERREGKSTVSMKSISDYNDIPLLSIFNPQKSIEVDSNSIANEPLQYTKHNANIQVSSEKLHSNVNGSSCKTKHSDVQSLTNVSNCIQVELHSNVAHNNHQFQQYKHDSEYIYDVTPREPVANSECAGACDTIPKEPVANSEGAGACDTIPKEPVANSEGAGACDTIPKEPVANSEGAGACNTIPKEPVANREGAGDNNHSVQDNKECVNNGNAEKTSESRIEVTMTASCSRSSLHSIANVFSSVYHSITGYFGEDFDYYHG